MTDAIEQHATQIAYLYRRKPHRHRHIFDDVDIDDSRSIYRFLDQGGSTRLSFYILLSTRSSLRCCAPIAIC